MNIDKEKLNSNDWYSTESGRRIETDGDCKLKKDYYHTQMVGVVNKVYAVNDDTAQKQCDHLFEHLDINMFSGDNGALCINIKCRKCGATYSGVIDKETEGWEQTDLYNIFTYHTYILGDIQQELIIKMVNSGDYTLTEAMLAVSIACERCLNVLLNKYECSDSGYEEYSEKWYKANTCCDFCSTMPGYVKTKKERIESPSVVYTDDSVFTRFMKWIKRK